MLHRVGADRPRPSSGLLPDHDRTTGAALSVVPDLLDHLRATFSPASMTTLDRVRAGEDRAALDPRRSGRESATPWAREKLFQLLNHRYAAAPAQRHRTSARVNEIEPRLQSRMLDTSRCTFFTITAPGYRGSEFAADRVQRRAPQRSVRAGDAARSPRPGRPASRNAVPLGIEWPTLLIVACTLAQRGASRP